MKAIFIMAVAILFFQGCSKPANETINEECANEDGTLITGRWNWVKSEGGISYRVETPASTGNHLDIIFKNDGTAIYSKNKILAYTGTYTVQTSTDPVTGAIVQTITQNYFNYYGQPEVQVLHIARDTLTFDEGGADRFVHTYEISPYPY